MTTAKTSDLNIISGDFDVLNKDIKAKQIKEQESKQFKIPVRDAFSLTKKKKIITIKRKTLKPLVEDDECNQPMLTDPDEEDIANKTLPDISNRKNL